MISDLDYPVENWTQEDVKNLRDTLATPTWQKVLATLQGDVDTLAQIIFNARVGTMEAVADLSRAQGSREATLGILINLALLSTSPIDDTTKD